jgi:catechol 2,3-dioxygenase-like lactoylglutathione lyase family enzyme
MTKANYPRSFSHIGITVPDITKAVQFYEEVMGWYVIMSPSTVVEENDTAIGQMCIDVFGKNWGTFEIAHMSTSDGIGVELFSFPNMTDEKPEFSRFKSGLFDFCVQDPDIEM